MAAQKIKVLIVDDSSFIRRALKRMLEEDPDITVVGLARDGVEAISKVQELNPDVVTLDVEMPIMNGIAALEVIMEKCPVPVIMVSSLTAQGAQETFDALELGALDYIPKNLEALSVNIVRLKTELIAKVRAVAKKKQTLSKYIKQRSVIREAKPPVSFSSKGIKSQRTAIVVIGASTGGPKAIQDVLKELPGDFPAGILVVQHMPKNFTGPYAERLNNICDIEVREASQNDIIKPGEALIAPGGIQTRLRRKGAIEVELIMEDTPFDAIYKPSVNITFLSVADCFPGRALGVILTGMGNDGMEGAKAIKGTGCRIVAQNEETCVVYGMPKAVIDQGIADKILPLEAVPGEILNMV